MNAGLADSPSEGEQSLEELMARIGGKFLASVADCRVTNFTHVLTDVLRGACEPQKDPSELRELQLFSIDLRLVKISEVISSWATLGRVANCQLMGQHGLPPGDRKSSLPKSFLS